MISRRQAREIALQILFQFEFIPNLDVSQSLELYRESFQAEPQMFEYVRELVTGIRRNLQDIDSQIQRFSQHWKINRMALVDLNVMRIAVYELRHGSKEVPPKVAINEAIEIAKHYGSGESSSFVNGILDQVAQSEGLT